jgi:transcriptional regulator with XRE-family HTH domain
MIKASMPPRRTGPNVPEAILFGTRVRKLREARDWSQERLAEESGLNTVQISHIENGRNEPKLRTILALAKAFGIRAGELIEHIKVRR